jgi:hypothetical protein
MKFITSHQVQHLTYSSQPTVECFVFFYSSQLTYLLFVV